MASPDNVTNESDAAAASRRRRFRILAVLVAVVGTMGGGYWLATRNHQTTDDAFIDADIVRIAPQVGGSVASLSFTDNQRVERGAPLLAIDPRDYLVALARAKADLDLARANRDAARADLDLTRATTAASVDEARRTVEQAHHETEEVRQEADAARAEVVRTGADVKRYRELARDQFASRQRLDQAVADSESSSARWRAAQSAVPARAAALEAARARLASALAAPQRIAVKQSQLANAEAQMEQAQAAVDGAELDLAYTKLAAPESGRMTKRAVNAGDVVQKSQILAYLVVDPPWVIANFKETQLTRMRPGQPVVIKVDAFPGHEFTGRVDSIQAGSGARFSLLPPENATGNYVKVVQRVPVKIVFDKKDDPMIRLLAPGMSVLPDVDVGADPEKP